MKNVLWIDDDFTAAHELSERLRIISPEQFQAHLVGTFQEALQMAGEHKYEAIIVDLMLSTNFTGTIGPYGKPIEKDLLQALRVRAPESKLVVISNYLDPGAIERARRIEGADIILAKASFVDDEFKVVLKELLPIRENPQIEPKPELVIPIRKTLVEVNRSLTNLFRKDPKLIRELDPIRFEELVAELFEEDGYRVVLTPPRADGGKDLYAFKKDRQLETSFLVECKRYAPPNKVGVEVVRQLYGLVQHERVSGGVIVTTSYFTRGANDFAKTVPYQLYLRDFYDLSVWLERAGGRGENT